MKYKRRLKPDERELISLIIKINKLSTIQNYIFNFITWDNITK